MGFKKSGQLTVSPLTVSRVAHQEHPHPTAGTSVHSTHLESLSRITGQFATRCGRSQHCREQALSIFQPPSRSVGRYSRCTSASYIYVGNLQRLYRPLDFLLFLRRRHRIKARCRSVSAVSALPSSHESTTQLDLIHPRGNTFRPSTPR